MKKITQEMRRGRQLNSNAGFTFTEIMVVVCIIGLLAGGYLMKNLGGVRPAAQAVTADGLQAQIESSYSGWVATGGVHNATMASTLAAQTSIAYDILTVLTAPQGTNFTPTNQATTGVTESSNVLSPPSNIIRAGFRGTLASGASGVTYKQYYILFKPTSTATGVWQVTTTAPASPIP